MIAVPIAIAVCGLILTILCKAPKVSQYALFFVIVMAVLVPSHAPSRDIRSVAVAGVILVLGIAIFRNYKSVAKSVPNVYLLFFILYSSLISFFEAEGPYSLFVLMTCVSYLLMAILVSQPGASGTKAFYAAVPLLIVLQLALSTAEEFLSTKAPWPLTNGTDFIAHRLNPIAPRLVGRAMGSTSHPIPLGVLMAIFLIFCLWVAIHTRRRSYWLFCLFAAIVVIYSGTRSAILAIAVCLAFWFSTTGGAKRLPGYLLGTVALLLIFVSVDPQTIPGFSGFYSSESYTHRANVLAFFPTLVDRSFFDLVFGSGYSSISSLLQSSFFSGGSGIQVFDQEYIRTLTATGLVGFTVLIMALVEGFRRGNLPSRLILICLSITFFSFDALSWNLLMTLFVIAASGPIFKVDVAGKHQAEVQPRLLLRSSVR